MTYPSVFEPAVTQSLIDRVEKLSPDTQPGWGKMNVGQMLAHVNVAYEQTYDNPPPKPNFLMGWFLKKFVKPAVVGPKPYEKNSRTAPAFLITDERDFGKEKARLISYLNRVQQEGKTAHEGKPSPSFGPLTAQEWSTLYYKHLDHHLTQFGV
ncbi:DUF1569 domain-containing protein [Lewinella sp. 4G2]|uniref:DUF1569 domain-containing protein n=1 Tax=Lewinella sp. 4G2 TaxID=1803372 RepID=UPI0007B4ACF3|nr:DUF1569 domain-containing protein [Lewinella sp. 4G2]OAV45982.1 hypothetical protein A3850_018990 [Lewinella sp. 4G2]